MNRSTAVRLAGAILAIVAIVAVFLALTRCQPKPRAEIEVTPASFATAIKNYACGDTLKLSAGTYNNPRWSTKDCPGADGVTIRSADPAQRAVFVGGVLMDNARSVIFQDVDLEHTTNTASYGFVWRAYAGRDVTFQRVHFKGTVAPDGGKWGYGITTSNVTGLTVEGCQFRDVYMGVSVGTVTNLRIVNNDITDFGSDGINLGGIVNGFVSGNYISRASPGAGAHPDGLQVQQPGSTRATQNLTVTENLIDVPFEGPGFQGLFGGSENGVRQSNVTFENNVVLNGAYNAITYGTTDGLRIVGNTVLFQQHPDPTWKAWIRVINGAGELRDNKAMSYILEGSSSTGMVQSGNVTLGFSSKKDIDDARAAWMAAHRGGPAPGPPNCDQCEADKAALQQRVSELETAVAALQAEVARLQKQIDDAVSILTAPPAKRKAAA